MGMFNILELPTQVHCPHCENDSNRTLQFKFGSKDLTRYRVGDSIHWGGSDEGVKGVQKAFVEGWLDVCPKCHADDDVSYDIEIQNDVIVSVVPSSGVIDYGELGWVIVEW